MAASHLTCELLYTSVVQYETEQVPEVEARVGTSLGWRRILRCRQSLILPSRSLVRSSVTRWTWGTWGRPRPRSRCRRRHRRRRRWSCWRCSPSPFRRVPTSPECLQTKKINIESLFQTETIESLFQTETFGIRPRFIFGHLTRDPHLDNVTRPHTLHRFEFGGLPWEVE